MTCENPVLCSALLLSEICLPTEFHVDTLYRSHVLSQTKCKNKQRAITLNLEKRELWFLCNALLLSEICLPTEFHVEPFIVLMFFPRQSVKINKGQLL